MSNSKPRFNTRAWISFLVAQAVVITNTMPPAMAQMPDERLFEEEEFEEPFGTFESAPPPPPPIPPSPDDFSNGGPAGFPDDSQDFGNPGESFPGGSGGGTSSARPSVSSGGGSRSSGTPSKPSGPPAKVKANSKAPPISQAQVEDITNENYPDLIESFDYPNAEITDIIKAISQLTGKNFIIDPGVRGKISIVAPSQITVAEAYKAFLSALAINGFTVVPSGKFLKVKNARNAQRDSIETYSGKYYPNSDVMITRIVHLKHISAEEVNKRLRILPSKDGEMTPYEPTNSIIISDYGSNIERIMNIINELDRPGFEEQLAVIPIRYAKSKDLADLINQIINKETTRGGGGGAPAFNAGVPRFRSRGGTPGGGTPEELSLVAPDDRTNSLIVVGNNAGIAKVRKLVKTLDDKIDPAEAGGVFVYYVRFGEAEKIQQTLTGLASGGSGGGGAPGLPSGGPPGFGRAVSPLDRQNIFGGDVRITADKNTNSLVITASKQDYDTVMSIIAKLDIPKDQVYVEGIIMEMNTDKNRSWNPTIYYLDKSSNGLGRAGFSRQGSLTSILNPAGDSGTILGFGSGEKLKFKTPAGELEVPSLLSFIQLLQQNVESNILSTPQILALDNEPAEIEVGENIPISTTTTATASGTTSDTKFEKASIKLNITPSIRPDSDVVRLKIDQSVKQPSNTVIRSSQLSASTTIISDRSIKTNIVVSNGDTAVLGGLVRDEETLDEVKVPILGDIPILGWLFKASSTQKKKVNLVIFLTPKIIRGVKDGHELLSKKANERIDWLKRNFDGRDPYGKKMDSLPRTSKIQDEETVSGEIQKKSNKKRP